MKKFTGWIMLGVVACAAVVLAQGNGTSVLNAFVKTLNDAPGLSVDYTAQMVGSSATEYKIKLNKPNQARIESNSQLIVADGKTITTYNKADKTYVKQPQTEADLMGLFASEELSVWKPFFDAKAFSKVVRVNAKPNRTVAGVNFRVIELVKDAQSRVVTNLFLDSGNMVRRAQTEIKDGSTEENLLLITRDLSTAAGKSEDFEFTAPEGSREVKMEELMAAKWYTNLDEAKEAAKKTKRKIFVDFYADW